MDIKQLMDSIEAEGEKYVSFLCDICAFEGRAEDTKTLNELADFISEFAKSEGFEIERCSIENCADFLCIDMNKGAEKGGLMLAHTDTVHEKGLFGTPPVKRLDDRIIAPGVIDCKGGIAIAMLVMKALAANGYKKNLRLILTTDEEVSNVLGGEAELEFFKEKCEGYPYAINCETTEGDEAVISRSGICKYQIDITGISGHTGVHYFECRNPIEEAAQKILALHKKSKKGVATYSCNIIRAGDAINVIPETCTVFLDVRFPRREYLENIKKTVADIVNTSFVEGTSSKLTLINVRPPMERSDETDALFQELLGVCKRHGLGSLTPVESGGGSDSCYTQAYGAASICGMGASGGLCHTKDEFAITSSIALRAKIISAFFAEKL